MQPNEDAADRPLWELLDCLPIRKAPGSFTDDVLRRIRLERAADSEPPFGAWLSQSWKTLLAVTASVALLVGGLSFQELPWGNETFTLNEASEMSFLLASVPVDELGEMGDLDTSVNETDIWLDNTSY